MTTDIIFSSLKNTLDSYSPISDTTWNKYKNICTIKKIKKNDYALDLYDNIDEVSYVYKGLFRTFTINEKAEEYTKNFFWETRFFGPMISLLTNKPIDSSVQALEDSIIVEINHTKYRELLYSYEDLKLFHILYLEKHWIIEKDTKGSSLVLEDAKLRYKRFLKEYSNIVPRLNQYHIASCLGISPTHLSRIKKELSQKI